MKDFRGSIQPPFVGKVKLKGRMSSQKLPGSFGVLFPGYSLPMKAERSRNKERLEASLAGLCELELLKQRQECRVLSALCLGDSPVPGRPPWGALRSARCALDAPSGSASEDLSLQTVSDCEMMRFQIAWAVKQTLLSAGVKGSLVCILIDAKLTKL